MARPVAGVATAGVHGRDFSDEDAHCGLAGAHLIDEGGKGGDDSGGREVGPDVICAEH